MPRETARWFDGASFAPGPDMDKVRVWLAAAQLHGLVFVWGGFQGERATEVLSAGVTAFLGAGPPTMEERDGAAALALDADRALVVGGWKLRSTELLHLGDDDDLRVARGPALATDRYNCAVVALDATRILVAGGLGGAGDTGALRTTEILDLATMAFSPGPSMGSARAHFAAVNLGGGRVLVAGGDDGEREGGLASTEILDVAAMAFEPGPAMKFPRFGLSLAPLDAAHVLVVGGMTAREPVDEEANPEGWEAVQIAALDETEARRVRASFSSEPPRVGPRRRDDDVRAGPAAPRRPLRLPGDRPRRRPRLGGRRHVGLRGPRLDGAARAAAGGGRPRRRGAGASAGAGGRGTAAVRGTNVASAVGTRRGRVRASAQSTRAKAAAFLEWRPPNTRVERYGARDSRLQF